MRTLHSLILTFCILPIVINAQSVPISVAAHDQLVQGPCHIFSSVAAMESRAIQSGCDKNDVNFLEWNLYSDNVCACYGGGSSTMLKGVIYAASTTGLFKRADAPNIPTNANQLPNPNIDVVPGIASFSCNIDMRKNMYEAAGLDTNTNCTDNEGSNFIVNPFPDTAIPLKYEYQGDGFEVDESPSAQEMKNQLSLGNGVIAVFENWQDRVAPAKEPVIHSVFFYAKKNNDWSYKDSWPGNPGNKTMASLPPPCGQGVEGPCLARTYHLTGRFECKIDCDGQIVGSPQVNGSTVYTIQGENTNDVSWTVNSNLIIVNQIGNSITVAPNGCVSGVGEIMANYNNNECDKTLIVEVNGESNTPNDILVFSPDWNNGNTCTNTVLELNVEDSNVEEVTYDWNIMGATMNNPNNNGPVNFVTTNEGDNVPLTFQVRVLREGCPPTPYTTITGIAVDCGIGGGQLNIDVGIPVNSRNGHLTFQLPTELTNSSSLQYTLYGIDGTVIKRDYISNNIVQVELPSITPQLIILHLFDPTTGFQQVVKHLQAF